jgi:hypothetical protein
MDFNIFFFAKRTSTFNDVVGSYQYLNRQSSLTKMMINGGILYVVLDFSFE